MKNLILSGLLLFPQLLCARVLLVTDMDDTVKVSHVLDADSAVRNTIETKNAFMGMPELYQALVKIPEATPMHYLSNAPNWLMKGFHKRFLNKNKFPKGVMVLNPKTLSHNHKVNSLRKMIEEFNPTVMILVGDNGEKDTLVYDQIRKEFPQIGGHTYIHMAYSQAGFKGSVGKPLESDQIGWVSSVDLAFDMMNKGYITSDDYARVVKAVEKRALAEDFLVERNTQMMFPAWFDCRDINIPTLPLISPELQTKMETRCGRGPYED